VAKIATPKTPAENAAEKGIVPMNDPKNALPTLAVLEDRVESHAATGFREWTLAAEALHEIKTRKLWKTAKGADGYGYANFSDYAERRFGFKKTYAYDLAKAAETGKLAAGTEREARTERATERAEAKPATREQILRMMTTATDKWMDRLGDLRDRLIDDEAFTAEYDAMMRLVDKSIQGFLDAMTPIKGSAVAENEDDENEDEDEPTAEDLADLDTDEDE